MISTCNRFYISQFANFGYIVSAIVGYEDVLTSRTRYSCLCLENVPSEGCSVL